MTKSIILPRNNYFRISCYPMVIVTCSIVIAIMMALVSFHLISLLKGLMTMRLNMHPSTLYTQNPLNHHFCIWASMTTSHHDIKSIGWCPNHLSLILIFFSTSCGPGYYVFHDLAIGWCFDFCFILARHQCTNKTLQALDLVGLLINSFVI